MNVNLKPICLLAIGAAVGSAVSYYICKNKLQKEFDRDRASIKAAYKKYYDERLNSLASQKLDKAVDTIMKQNGLSSEELKERAKDKPPEPERRNYMDYTHYANAKSTVSTKPKEPAPDIFEITLEEYLRNNGFKKEVYEYWNEDDILTDEKGGQVDIDVVVGKQPWRTIESGEEDDIYVRNTILQSDMEIQVREASYSEEIMGL